jgi:hypothetical protein
MMKTSQVSETCEVFYFLGLFWNLIVCFGESGVPPKLRGLIAHETRASFSEAFFDSDLNG